MSENVEKVLENLGIHIVRVSPSGNIIAHCPFLLNHKHNDRNPSFSVQIETGLYHCFAGCSSGSLLDLVLRLRGCELDEALQFVHQEELTGRFFSALKGIENTETEEKSIDISCYDFNNMYAYMTRRGFSLEELKKWHVGIDDSDKSVVIPVFYRRTIVGIIKRFLYGNRRYWNSEGDWKHSALFGYDQFRPTDGWVNVCEGALNCIWMHQKGYRNTVATMGAHVSEEQFEILVGMGAGIRFCYDNDEAGKSGIAALRKKYGRKIAIDAITLPDDKNDVQEIENLRHIIKTSFIQELHKNSGEHT